LARPGDPLVTIAARVWLLLSVSKQRLPRMINSSRDITMELVNLARGVGSPMPINQLGHLEPALCRSKKMPQSGQYGKRF
jgi:hypothetical protein